MVNKKYQNFKFPLKKKKEKDKVKEKYYCFIKLQNYNYKILINELARIFFCPFIKKRIYACKIFPLVSWILWNEFTDIIEIIKNSYGADLFAILSRDESNPKGEDIPNDPRLIPTGKRSIFFHRNSPFSSLAFRNVFFAINISCLISRRIFLFLFKYEFRLYFSLSLPPLLSMDPLNFDTWIETQLTGAILNAKNTWNVVQLKTNNHCEKNVV